MVLLVIPRPLSVGHTYKAVNVVSHLPIVAGWPTDGKAVEVDILSDVVNWNVETGSVGHIEDVHFVRQRVTLGDLRALSNRDVRAPLPGLPEDIALAVVDEVRLVGVIAKELLRSTLLDLATAVQNRTPSEQMYWGYLDWRGRRRHR